MTKNTASGAAPVRRVVKCYSLHMIVNYDLVTSQFGASLTIMNYAPKVINYNARIIKYAPRIVDYAIRQHSLMTIVM
jgi:hypothetical protein